MLEDTPDQRAYKEYLAKVGNTPIDSKVAGREQGVLDNAASRAYKPKIYEDTIRADAISGMPEGELYKTDMNESELEQAIKQLTAARAVLTDFLVQSQNPAVANAKDTTLDEFEENLGNFPPPVAQAFNTVLKHLNPESDTVLFDLPELIKDNLQKYTIILEHLKKKATT